MDATALPREDHTRRQDAPTATGRALRRPPRGPVPALRRGVATAVCAGVIGALLTACGATSGRVDGARDAGRAFQRAVAARDYPAACGLLAPRTRQQLEEDEKQRCGQALGGQQLPTAAPAGSPEVYGRQASLDAGGQKLFLSQFRAGWKVVAAGCTPRGGDKPYRCVVKGG
ncbi:hypothetical protein [Streptomyces sp. YS-3]|uniref:hypothetical protein n=1 Tax=Streptomyces sp. YS-3 TaxID=3381352 RepID=UPI0038623B72